MTYVPLSIPLKKYSRRLLIILPTNLSDQDFASDFFQIHSCKGHSYFKLTVDTVKLCNGLIPSSYLPNRIHYTKNKMVFHIVSKKQQENIILFLVVISSTT